MTTILGIKTNEGKPAIILAADRQSNEFEGDELTQKKDINKLIKSESETWAVTYTGIIDNPFQSFFKYLVGEKTKVKKDKKNQTKPDIRWNFEKFLKNITENHTLKLPPIFSSYKHAFEIKKDYERISNRKILSTNWEKELAEYMGSKKPKHDFAKKIIEILKHIMRIEEDPVAEALRNNHFVELDLLNKIFSLKYKGDTATELIIASNKSYSAGEKNQLGLYHANSYGMLEPAKSSEGLEYICLGTGSVKVEPYFKAVIEGDAQVKYSKDISFDSITERDAKALAFGAFDKAVRDGYTGENFDLVIIRENSIEEFGQVFSSKVKKYKHGLIKEFIEKGSD